MKRVISHIFFCLVLISNLLAQVSADNEFINDQLYVKIITSPNKSGTVQYIPHPDNPDVGKSTWEIIEQYGGESMVLAFSTSYHELQNVYKVTLKSGSDIDALITVLNASNKVQFAEKIPIYSITAKPIDLDESKQWYFKTINMDDSWGVDLSTLGNKVIAVIDNGVNYRHTDLQRSIAVNTEEVEGDGIDNDNNGYVDDFLGWNVVDNNGNPEPLDIDPMLRNSGQFKTFGWHGTHVAGILGAGSNNGGIASLGLKNKVLCIKAAGLVNGEPKDNLLYNINEAFEYAIKRKVDIINCSFGSRSKSIVTQSIINEARSKGIIVVAAAGNLKSEDPFYPAAYDNVIAVGATDREDKVWKFSNRGSYIDVMAPGHEIYSTVSTDNYSFGYLSGTSMAAPIVSGFAGLILSNEPDRIDQVEEIIKGGCDNIDSKNPDFIGKMGAGRINIDKGFEYILSITSTQNVVKQQGFNAYPNPSSTSIYIPFLEVSPSGQPVTLRFVNAVGAEVSVQKIASQNQPVLVSHLPQGVYQLIVTTTDGRDLRSRIVVNR